MDKTLITPNLEKRQYRAVHNEKYPWPTTLIPAIQFSSESVRNFQYILPHIFLYKCKQMFYIFLLLIQIKISILVLELYQSSIQIINIKHIK